MKKTIALLLAAFLVSIAAACGLLDNPTPDLCPSLGKGFPVQRGYACPVLAKDVPKLLGYLTTGPTCWGDCGAITCQPSLAAAQWAAAFAKGVPAGTIDALSPEAADIGCVDVGTTTRDLNQRVWDAINKWQSSMECPPYDCEEDAGACAKLGESCDHAKEVWCCEVQQVVPGRQPSRLFCDTLDTVPGTCAIWSGDPCAVDGQCGGSSVGDEICEGLPGTPLGGPVCCIAEDHDCSLPGLAAPYLDGDCCPGLYCVKDPLAYGSICQ